jgi:hypothetical protein
MTRGTEANQLKRDDLGMPPSVASSQLPKACSHATKEPLRSGCDIVFLSGCCTNGTQPCLRSRCKHLFYMTVLIRQRPALGSLCRQPVRQSGLAARQSAPNRMAQTAPSGSKLAGNIGIYGPLRVNGTRARILSLSSALGSIGSTGALTFARHPDQVARQSL